MADGIKDDFPGVDIDRVHKKINGVDYVSDYIQSATDDAKKQYMQRIWQMSKEQLFHEVMRVQAEAAKLLNAAQSEIHRLKGIIEGDDFSTSD